MTLRRTHCTAPALFFLLLSASLLPVSAQTSAHTLTAPTSSSSTTSAAMPSTVMQPALASLHQALEILRPERWKASGAVTAESANDVSSIERDLDTTLPPLLAAADAAPASTTALLPAYRNVEALYDVVVRVTQTAILAAPAQQSGALQQATAALQQSRRDFADLLSRTAEAQDSQLRDTQARVRALQTAASQPAPVCAPVPPVKKTKPHAKPKLAASKSTAAQ